MLFLNATKLISETADFHQRFHYNERLDYYEMKENCLFFASESLTFPFKKCIGNEFTQEMLKNTDLLIWTRRYKYMVNAIGNNRKCFQISSSATENLHR